MSKLNDWIPKSSLWKRNCRFVWVCMSFGSLAYFKISAYFHAWKYVKPIAIICFEVLGEVSHVYETDNDYWFHIPRWQTPVEKFKVRAMSVRAFFLLSYTNLSEVIMLVNFPTGLFPGFQLKIFVRWCCCNL